MHHVVIILVFAVLVRFTGIKLEYFVNDIHRYLTDLFEKSFIYKYFMSIESIFLISFGIVIIRVLFSFIEFLK